MIYTLVSKDIFTNVSRYSYGTTLSMRLLMIILNVGKSTRNSSWIQGNCNQALNFVDDILQKTENLCVENGIDPNMIESNLRYILYKIGTLSIRREYSKRTIGIGRAERDTKDHSEIDEIFETFDMAGLRRKIRDEHCNMCDIAGCIYDRVSKHCADIGVWDGDDDLAFKELIENRLCLFSDRTRYVYPINKALDTIFK